MIICILMLPPFTRNATSACAAEQDSMEEPQLIPAFCTQTACAPDGEEVNLNSSQASVSAHNGSFSSSVADSAAARHHQVAFIDRQAADPLLHSIPAKRRSFITWSSAHKAKSDLHQSLLSAAHAADHQAILLPCDSFADTYDVVAEQRHGFWQRVSSIFAALWRLLCHTGITVQHWMLCCPQAATPDSDREDIPACH